MPIFEGKPIQRKTPLFWQYDRALGWAKVALRNGDWKILADEKLKEFELYNIKNDVSEKNDLAKQEPQRIKKMSAELTRLHAQVKAEGPTWP